MTGSPAIYALQKLTALIVSPSLGDLTRFQCSSASFAKNIC